MTDFGRDISCTDDTDAMFSELADDDIRLVTQAIYRRMITPKGGLLDDPLYGYDIRSELNGQVDVGSIARIIANVRAQCVAEETVDSVAITASVTGDNPSEMTINLDVSGECGLGPFKFTLNVSKVGVALLQDGVS